MKIRAVLIFTSLSRQYMDSVNFRKFPKSSEYGLLETLGCLHVELQANFKGSFGSRYSRMDQVKFVEDSL